MASRKVRNNESRNRETPVFMRAFIAAQRAGDAVAMELINAAYNADLNEWFGLGFPFVFLTYKYCSVVAAKYNLDEGGAYMLEKRLLYYEQGVTEFDVWQSDTIGVRKLS